MKNKHIVIIGSIICVLGSISAIGLASSESISSDARKNISDKLEQYSRMQNALNTIEKADQADGYDTGFSVQDAAKKASDLGNNIDTVISDIEKIQSKRKENEDHYKAILQQVKKVIIDIKTTKQTVIDSVGKINIYTQRMIDTHTQLEETKKYLDNTRETFVKLLPALYIIQNAYTNQAGSVDDLKLILESNSISDTLSFDDMLQGLSIKLDTLLIQLQDAQKRYTQSLKDIHDIRKQLKKTTLTYREKIHVLEEQRGYLLDFLSLYKGKKITLDKTISNLFETRSQLTKRIQTMILKIASLQTTETGLVEQIPAYQEFSGMADDREKKGNFLGRPVLPINTIQTFYGDMIDIGGASEVFSGIRIDADQGQEIYAPANGIVYYVQDQDNISTNLIIIMHKNGYISVFTNVNKVLVKTQDIVRRGQIIGLVGGQPGTRGAGWFSASPTASMQVFKDGKAIDPVELIDLSVINIPNILPEKYLTKYDIDRRLRNINIDFTDTKFMPGNTVEERRQSFLDKVAAGPYTDIMLWEKAAEGTNVDIDLGICIGYAETSMGRHFASDNNVGNVGNNDRGDRVDKDSPLDGAAAIYNVLNNQYLGGYRTVYELSGYGNKDGAIYASSEYNWQKNVTRCLSTIKGYIVPEDYPFRKYSEPSTSVKE